MLLLYDSNGFLCSSDKYPTHTSSSQNNNSKNKTEQIFTTGSLEEFWGSSNTEGTPIKWCCFGTLRDRKAGYVFSRLSVFLYCLYFHMCSFYSIPPNTEENVCMEGGGKGPSGEYSFILITSQFRDLPGRNSHHSYSQTKGKKNFQGLPLSWLWCPALSWMYYCDWAWFTCLIPRIPGLTPPSNSRDGAGRELSLDGREGFSSTGGRKESAWWTKTIGDDFTAILSLLYINLLPTSLGR